MFTFVINMIAGGRCLLNCITMIVVVGRGVVVCCRLGCVRGWLRGLQGDLGHFPALGNFPPVFFQGRLFRLELQFGAEHVLARRYFAVKAVELGAKRLLQLSFPVNNGLAERFKHLTDRERLVPGRNFRV